MAKIELKKVNENGTSEILFLQVVRDNTSEIIELLSELNIIDDFDYDKQAKLIELSMALLSHDGKLDIK